MLKPLHATNVAADLPLWYVPCIQRCYGLHDQIDEELDQCVLAAKHIITSYRRTTYQNLATAPSCH